MTEARQSKVVKLREQLAAAHEAIDLLRGENAAYASATRDVLRFHDSCLCRHAKKFLRHAKAVADANG